MRRRRATVATPGEWRLAVANGPNIFQMLLVFLLRIYTIVVTVQCNLVTGRVATPNGRPIDSCRPPSFNLVANLLGVATVARRLRIDVHDDNNYTTRDRGDRYGPIEWARESDGAR